MTEIMRGATHVRQFISDFLESAVPPAIDLARAQWGVADWQLPYPSVYDSYDPLLVSQFPSVGSVISRTSGWSRVDLLDAAEQQYEARYAARVFVWARTPMRPDGTYESPTYDTALRTRDDLLALIRSVILGTPSLGTTGLCRVDEGSLAEDYLDAIKQGDESPRWMSGGTLSFDMQVVETTYLTPLGAANTISVEEGLLPKATE